MLFISYIVLFEPNCFFNTFIKRNLIKIPDTWTWYKRRLVGYFFSTINAERHSDLRITSLGTAFSDMFSGTPGRRRGRVRRTTILHVSRPPVSYCATECSPRRGDIRFRRSSFTLDNQVEHWRT